jgi:hypothetical protein
MGTSYDQGMDIYVVLNIWKERTSVAGAATDRSDAEALADRLGGPYPWGEWWSANPDSGTRERRARWADGSPHPDHRQEIVEVPLAGLPAVGLLPPDAREVAKWGHQKVVYDADVPPPELNMERMKRLITELHDRWRQAATDIRVGDGPARFRST